MEGLDADREQFLSLIRRWHACGTRDDQVEHCEETGRLLQEALTRESPTRGLTDASRHGAGRSGHDLYEDPVLNEVQQRLFIDRLSRASGLTTSCDLTGRPLRRYVDTGHYISALAIIREGGCDEEAIRRRNPTLLEGYEKYDDLLGERRHFDYSSILEKALDALIDDDAVKGSLRERVRHVIVDEYQDVNPVQEGVIWALKELGGDVCVVGDDDQTIYQWRGSTVVAILDFEKRYRGVTQIRLEENFRSSRGIVETARAFIQQNGERLPKEMQPTGAQADEKGDVVALSFGSPDEEADHIARTARSLHGVAIREDGGQMRGITWADMAVLLRTVKGNGAPIMRALDRAKVPEAIHFQSKPSDKYESFAGFLQHGAEDAYPEAWLDNEYANPDAVRVMTIHQAKGMQWPVVFVPALSRTGSRRRHTADAACGTCSRPTRSRTPPGSRAASRTSGASSTSP